MLLVRLDFFLTNCIYTSMHIACSMSSLCGMVYYILHVYVAYVPSVGLVNIAFIFALQVGLAYGLVSLLAILRLILYFFPCCSVVALFSCLLVRMFVSLFQYVSVFK